MARALLESAGGGAATGFLPPWLAALGMVVASVWIVSMAVFLCGRSSHAAADDLPKKKPAAAKPISRPAASVAPAKARSSARSGGTVVDATAMYGAAYVSGVACGGSGGGGCGGGGGGGGGGCGGGGC